MIATLLSPAGRINAGQFWNGYLVLFGAALVLAAGAAFGPGWLFFAGFLLLYPMFCVYGKRFHDKGDSAWMALAPIAAAGLAWFAVLSGVGMMVGFSGMGLYAQSQGIPSEELFTAMQDPSFQAGFQEWVAADENAAAVQDAIGFNQQLLEYGPTLAFWVVAGLMGLWVASGRDPEENEHGAPA